MTIVANSQRCPICARSHAARTTAASSRLRPTKRVSRRRPASPSPRRSRYAGTGLDLPLSSSGSTGSTSTASRARARALPSKDLARLGCLLQPRRNVHRVARQPSLGSGDHFARHDADPPLQPELGERVPHLECRAGRLQCVVLVHHRHAEHSHHGVADEFLDGAAIALDDPPHPLEVPREQRAQPLRVELFSERGRAREVAEENRDRLALLLRERVAEREAALLGNAPLRFSCPQFAQTDILCESGRERLGAGRRDAVRRPEHAKTLTWDVDDSGRRVAVRDVGRADLGERAVGDLAERIAPAATSARCASSIFATSQKTSGCSTRAPRTARSPPSPVNTAKSSPTNAGS